MTHQPTQLNCLLGSEPVGVWVISLQLKVSLHSSLIPNSLIWSGLGPLATQQLSGVGWCVIAKYI